MDRKGFINEQELLFERLSQEAGDGGELASAMKKMYSLFDESMVDWFANLYDTETGGYYYSNSARDNKTVMFQDKEYDLLPDAESTCQALGFISSSGLARECENSYTKALPDWAVKKTGEFIYSLQDPDGYFYHPQWGKEISLSRRARDFNWSIGILRNIGITPKYQTILDKKPEDKSSSGETLIPEHLSSKEKFLEYLEAGNIAENSYSLGNQISCQAPQIRALGLLDVCADYLDAHQHPETGIWHNETTYLGINGVMKITGFYNSAHRPIPNALRTAESAIAAITSEQYVGAVVDLWNTWEAVIRILINLRECGGEKGARDAEEIVKQLRANAPYAIEKSYEKISRFKKPDGGFSYKQNGTSFTSQGSPVAIKESAEGDVNATVISSTHLVTSILGTLNLGKYKVPMFGECDRQRYVEILENNRK